MNTGVGSIARAASRGQWDRLDAPKPWFILYLDVDQETEQVGVRFYHVRTATLGSVVEVEYDLSYLSLHRMIYSRHPGGAFLFEVSLDEYDAKSGRYDVVVGLVGDRRCSSRVRVGIWGEESTDEIVVAAGELRPVWRRATVFPRLNHRFRLSRGPPATFRVLSGPAVRVVCAVMYHRDRTAMAAAGAFRISGELSVTADKEDEEAATFELPDMTESLYRSAELVGARCAGIKKELMEAVWHPRRVATFMGGVEALDDV
jgi:hypothetical protein